MHDKPHTPVFTMPIPFHPSFNGTYLPHPMYPHYGFGNQFAYDFNLWNKVHNLQLPEMEKMNYISSLSSGMNNSNSMSSVSSDHSSKPSLSLFQISLCLLCTAELPRHHPSKCPMLKRGKAQGFWPSVCHNCRHLIPEHDSKSCPNAKSLHYPGDIITVNNDTVKHNRLHLMNSKFNSFKKANDDSVLGTKFIHEKTRKTFKPKEDNHSHEKNTKLPPISNFLIPKKGHHETCNNINCFNKINSNDTDAHTLPPKRRISSTYTLPNPVLLDAYGLPIDLNQSQVCIEPKTQESKRLIIPSKHPLNPKKLIVNESISNESITVTHALPVKNPGSNKKHAIKSDDSATSSHGSSKAATHFVPMAQQMSSDSEADVFTSDDEEDAFSVINNSTIGFHQELLYNGVSKCSALKHTPNLLLPTSKIKATNCPESGSDHEKINVITESLLYIGAL